MNTLKTLLVIITVLALQSCKNEERTTASGLKYTMLKEGEGQNIEDGQFILMNMMYKDNNDSIWMDTKEQGIPVVVPKNDSLWKSSEGSIEQIFNELSMGDSVSFSLKIADFFTNTVKAEMPPSIDQEGTLTFYVGIADVLNQDEIMEWQQKMMQKRLEKQEEEAAEQLIEDVASIEDYLNENGIEAQKTESGLYYVITQEGTGQQADAGDSVQVNYAGRILDGPYFDTSMKEVAQENGLYDERREPYGPLTFVLGQGRVIKGWDEGIALLKEGGKATLYIPSPLAYGPRQRGPIIQANSILVFDVELVDVKK